MTRRDRQQARYAAVTGLLAYLGALYAVCGLIYWLICVPTQRHLEAPAAAQATPTLYVTVSVKRDASRLPKARRHGARVSSSTSLP